MFLKVKFDISIILILSNYLLLVNYLEDFFLYFLADLFKYIRMTKCLRLKKGQNISDIRC